MNPTIRRVSKTPFGIFSNMFDEQNNVIFATLEHSYNCLPKLADGIYICRRGNHRLHDGVLFETFEILGVPDFNGKPVTGVLFHVGNFGRDSEGCVLVGKEAVSNSIVESKVSFARFMAMQAGIDEFTLTVKT